MFKIRNFLRFGKLVSRNLLWYFLSKRCFKKLFQEIQSLSRCRLLQPYWVVVSMVTSRATYLVFQPLTLDRRQMSLLTYYSSKLTRSCLHWRSNYPVSCTLNVYIQFDLACICWEQFNEIYKGNRYFGELRYVKTMFHDLV